MARKPHADSFGIRRAPTVLLILDMLSDFNFPQGEALLRAARRIAPRIAHLKSRVAKYGIPAIYVNDNLGPWRSSLKALIAACTSPPALGAEVVELLEPNERDLVVMKPRHSAFYATPLAAMLDEAKTSRLILTGLSSHQCVLFTANDAHLRELELCIPADCIGAPSAAQTRFALKYFGAVLGADVHASVHLRLQSQPKLGRA